MSSLTDENKKIAKKFFEALSTGSDKYLDFYTDDSVIWTAGDNAIGGTRTKKEIINFAQNILAAFPSGITFKITGMTAEEEKVAVEVEKSSQELMAEWNEINKEFTTAFNEAMKSGDYSEVQKVTKRSQEAAAAYHKKYWKEQEEKK